MPPSRPLTQPPERPQLWMIAGPNGSGKSSFYDTGRFKERERPIWIINPDLLTVRLAHSEGLDLDDANRQSLDRMMDWLVASVRTYQTIGVETVLSSPKYRALVEEAKARGFEFVLIYFVLATAEDQIARIRARVAKGGHHVPDNKVRARRLRSFTEARWFLAAADAAMIYDNTGAEPDEIGGKLASGETYLSPDAPADLIAALTA